jgi:hypothetical protein
MEEEIIDADDYIDLLKWVLMQRKEGRPFLNPQAMQKFPYYDKFMK